MIPLGVLASSYVAGGGLALTYQSQSANYGTQSTSYTASGLALGDASSDRHIVVMAYTSQGETGRSITGITVAGVSCTLAANVSNATGTTNLAIGHALVTSGTTGDVVVTLNLSGYGWNVGVYSMTGAESLSYTADTSLTNSPSVTNVAGGVVVAAAGRTLGDYTFTGVTEDFEADRSWGTLVGGSTSSTGTITATLNTDGLTAAVAYSPA